MTRQRRRKHKWARLYDIAFCGFHEAQGWPDNFMATMLHWGAMVRFPHLHDPKCPLCHSIGLFFTVR